MDIDESLFQEPPEQNAPSQYDENGEIRWWYVRNPQTDKIEVMFSDKEIHRVALGIIEDCKPMAREAGLSIRSYMRKTLLNIAKKA